MQRTSKQKQQKQAEQSDSWPSHKPQLQPEEILFLFKNHQQLLVAGDLLTAMSSMMIGNNKVKTNIINQNTHDTHKPTCQDAVFWFTEWSVGLQKNLAFGTVFMFLDFFFYLLV
mgnify:CR=1 FL=1